MNSNSLKRILIITAICLTVFVVITLLIKLLPYLILAGLLCFAIISIKGHFRKNKIMKDYNSNTSNNGEQGEVIDVDFKEE